MLAGLNHVIKQLLIFKVHIVAFAWGLCEATFFFIVPDVWLSLIAKNDLKLAFKAAIFSLIGALLGGYFMYFMGSNYLEATLSFLKSIPAINESLITQAQQSIEKLGALAIVVGGFKGVPYKIFATISANGGIGFFVLSIATIVARLLRFFAVILMVRFITKLLLRLDYQGNLTKLILSVWIVFYCFYFWQFSA